MLYLTTVRSADFGGKQLQEFRPRPALWNEHCFTYQVGPLNKFLTGEWMALGKCDDNALAPHRQRTTVPARNSVDNERDINIRRCEITDQIVT
jgi:hypothetical protein